MVDTSPFIKHYFGQVWALNPGGLSDQDPEATRRVVLAWLADTSPAAPSDSSSAAGSSGTGPAPWRVVVGHHPLASNGGESREAEGAAELADMAWLKEELVKHRVPLYLSGHEHNLELIEAAQGSGLLLATSGAGSDVRAMAGWGPGVKYQAADQGLLAVRLFQDRALLEFYVAHGEAGASAPDYAFTAPRRQ
jgi:hypothetical protein